MGHEFTGTVKEVGSEVKTVKVGDKIVSPFTASWSVYLIILESNHQPNTVPVVNASTARMDSPPAAQKACSSAQLALMAPRQSLSESHTQMAPW